MPASRMECPWQARFLAFWQNTLRKPPNFAGICCFPRQGGHTELWRESLRRRPFCGLCREGERMSKWLSGGSTQIRSPSEPRRIQRHETKCMGALEMRFNESYAPLLENSRHAPRGNSSPPPEPTHDLA